MSIFSSSSIKSIIVARFWPLTWWWTLFGSQSETRSEKLHWTISKEYVKGVKKGFSITFNFGTDNKQCKLKRQLKLVSYLLIVWPRLCSDPDDPLSKNLTDFHKIWLKLSSSTKAYNDVGDDGDGPSQMINVGDKFEVFVTACIFLVAI